MRKPDPCEERFSPDKLIILQFVTVYKMASTNTFQELLPSAPVQVNLPTCCYLPLPHQTRTTVSGFVCADEGERRVCVLCPNQNAYSETFIRAHIRYLPAHVRVIYGGWFPLVIDTGELLLDYLSPLLKTIHRHVGRTAKFTATLFKEHALRTFLRENCIDVVLAEYGPTATKVSRACTHAHVPYIVFFHGFDAFHENTLRIFGKSYQRVFTDAAAIIAAGHALGEQLVRLGAPREKIHCMPASGVDLSLFYGADPSSAPPHFCAVGRFVEKKAPHLTIQAFSAVKRQSADAHMTMVGNGPLLEQCKELVKTLHLEKAITFLPPLPHEEVARLMRSARAFVQHSVTAQTPGNRGDSEGIPIAIVEAAASGLPVVSTRHSGIPEIVTEGETGFLVEERDINGMTEYMLQLARDPALAGKMGQAARERAQKIFSMEALIARLWHIFERVL
ncbi:glycosyl transferase family 1 [Candidatus Peregrinibacteria bacterium CG10_big_fil_rev_8_21_14_0_10_55_24]|nr:MAG: glycosyl transferase family 1 [Candidatus Peregrinibacteria bacterium CG10_big_fil_rev_8_21_14_0_10_55_24]